MNVQTPGKRLCLEEQLVGEACGRRNQATVENTACSSFMSFLVVLLCLWHPAQATCFNPSADEALCFTPIAIGTRWAHPSSCIPGTLSSIRLPCPGLCTPQGFSKFATHSLHSQTHQSNPKTVLGVSLAGAGCAALRGGKAEGGMFTESKARLQLRLLMCMQALGEG